MSQILTGFNALSPQEQVEVLATPGAISGTVTQAEQAIALIRSLPPEEQAEVLAASYGISALPGDKPAEPLSPAR